LSGLLKTVILSGTMIICIGFAPGVLIDGRK